MNGSSLWNNLHFHSGAAGLLSDSLYLDRYGFIPSNPDSSKPELPIGFAHGGPMQDANGVTLRNPRTNADMTTLGLTCAACQKTAAENARSQLARR